MAGCATLAAISVHCVSVNIRLLPYIKKVLRMVSFGWHTNVRLKNMCSGRSSVGEIVGTAF
jgi:hypothetical protein